MDSVQGRRRQSTLERQWQGVVLRSAGRNDNVRGCKHQPFVSAKPPQAPFQNEGAAVTWLDELGRESRRQEISAAHPRGSEHGRTTVHSRFELAGGIEEMNSG